MNAVDVPYGMRLLYDAGITPPNPKRAALADASPEELETIARDQLALQTTATLMVLDQFPPDTAEVSAGAMQTILAAMAPGTSAEATHALPTNLPDQTSVGTEQQAKASAPGATVSVFA